jgi:predicted ATP-grasp superfamily ATP-dependent carboligase
MQGEEFLTHLLCFSRKKSSEVIMISLMEVRDEQEEPSCFLVKEP